MPPLENRLEERSHFEFAKVSSPAVENRDVLSDVCTKIALLSNRGN